MILSVFITVISGHDKPQPPGCLLGNSRSLWGNSVRFIRSDQSLNIPNHQPDSIPGIAPILRTERRLMQKRPIKQRTETTPGGSL
ncbi:hypothetical protein D9H76_25080, partial [Escherichia coli]|nr:hypothetical protein [Escherichia coli]